MTALGGTIAFVGAGNMGQALIKGLLGAHRKTLGSDKLRASDIREAQRSAVAERFGIKVFASNADAVEGADVVVLAVKPQIYDTVLDELRDALPPQALVISIAAGRSLASIEQHLRPATRVLRAMPNVAALVGCGATALAGGTHATEADVKLGQRIFESIGIVRVLDESLLDAATGLSGSGPAYIFLVIEALSDAGVKVGLSRWDAHALACQTVLGAAQLVIETQEHTGRLKDMVCSPGGTAIAAIHTLEEGGLRTTLINAVEVATQRSRELGRGDKQ